MFTELSDRFEPGSRILPQLKSLLHTYPHFKQKGVRFSFYIMPASEYFVTELDKTMIEHGRNKVPYASLEAFAQSLVDTQRWAELTQLIDGMDLNEDWGPAHLDLGAPSQTLSEYVVEKNKKIMSSCADFPGTRPGVATLTEKPVDRMKKWQTIVGGKKNRIGLPLTKDRYATQFRQIGSQDPRLREDRAV